MSDNKQPTHRAYSVIPRPTKDDPDNKFWHNIGTVFWHGDEKGFDILLEVPPRDLKIVCREIKEKDDEPEKAPEPQRKSYKK